MVRQSEGLGEALHQPDVHPPAPSRQSSHRGSTGLRLSGSPFGESAPPPVTQHRHRVRRTDRLRLASQRANSHCPKRDSDARATPTDNNAQITATKPQRGRAATSTATSLLRLDRPRSLLALLRSYCLRWPRSDLPSTPRSRLTRTHTCGEARRAQYVEVVNAEVVDAAATPSAMTTPPAAPVLALPAPAVAPHRRVQRLLGVWRANAQRAWQRAPPVPPLPRRSLVFPSLRVRGSRFRGRVRATGGKGAWESEPDVHHTGSKSRHLDPYKPPAWQWRCSLTIQRRRTRRQNSLNVRLSRSRLLSPPPHPTLPAAHAGSAPGGHRRHGVGVRSRAALASLAVAAPALLSPVASRL